MKIVENDFRLIFKALLALEKVIENEDFPEKTTEKLYEATANLENALSYHLSKTY